MGSNQSYLVSLMSWSYTRLKSYEACPYQFFLKYIELENDSTNQFFSKYGSFVHDILKDLLSEKISKVDAVNKYLSGFYINTLGRCPDNGVKSKYMHNGLQYIANFKMPKYKILGVEKEVHFSIDKYDFVGFIDLIGELSGKKYVICDHKSRVLSNRSKRKKPTAKDAELDEYLKQLYLYSVAVEQEYGELPSTLMFNCYREQKTVTEPFNMDAFSKAKDWAVSTIHKIENEKEWNPNLDYWRCNYLCQYTESCEYLKMFGGDW